MIRSARTVLLATTISLASATPAFASPTPSPVAPEHTTTACTNVLTHNVQTTEDTRSALPAQLNFAAVGSAFGCG